MPDNDTDRNDVKQTVLSVLREAIHDWGTTGRTLLMVAVLGIFWLIYLNQNVLIQGAQRVFLAAPSAPSLNPEGLDSAADTLMKLAKADGVMVASMVFTPNESARVVERIYLKEGGRYRQLDGQTEGLFRLAANSKNLIFPLFSGGVQCSDGLSGLSNPVLVLYAEQGFSYVCTISIPPEPQSLVGFIAVAWKDRKTAESVRNLDDVLMLASEKATKRSYTMKASQ
jgi:hypothetical protein